jgi:hypothetical protein
MKFQNPSHTAFGRVCRAASRIREAATVPGLGLNAGGVGIRHLRSGSRDKWYLGWIARVFVPNGLFEVGAEKPDGLRGVTRRNREVQIGLRSLSNMVSAWAGNCKTG